MITTVARALRRRLRDTVSSDAGFSLIEVVVSFVLVSIVASGATYGIVSSLQASHLGQQRVAAANVAQSFITSTENATSLVQPESGRQFGPTVGTESFVVHRWITFNTTGATQCSPGNTFTVNVIVAQGNTGTFLARSDGVVAC